MIPDNAQKKFRMAGILHANLIRGTQPGKQLSLQMECVYEYVCFDLTPMLLVRKV